MTTEDDVRRVFNEAIASEPTADRRAKLELLREYCVNPSFRRRLADFVAHVNAPIIEGKARTVRA